MITQIKSKVGQTGKDITVRNLRQTQNLPQNLTYITCVRPDGGGDLSFQSVFVCLCVGGGADGG